MIYILIEYHLTMQDHSLDYLTSAETFRCNVYSFSMFGGPGGTDWDYDGFSGDKGSIGRSKRRV